MKIAELRRLPATTPTGESVIRTTEGQDAPIEDKRPHWKRRRIVYIAGAALALIIAVLVWLLTQWSDLKNTVSADRLRIVSVTKGHFVRDVAAQGTVIAAVNPTLFAIAPGTINYIVHAGDTVTKGQPLATLESPDLRNEYERERATLDSLNAALARQEIEIRRQILLSKQQADLAKVSITAAEREEKRAQSAWDERVISERDYRRAIDDLDSAKLNYDHATATAALEQDSLALELRTKRLERDRQSLVVENLKNRVGELTVRSPVNGMVANLAQTEKARVPESAPLVTVVDLTAFEIEFQVAETYAQDIKSGMTADITLDGRPHAGIVTAISPEVRQSQVTGRVKFSGTQPPGLRQNQRAAVRIVLDERNEVVKFERGSFIDDATRQLYVVRGDHAVLVPVQLGAASVAEVEVVRGLQPGEHVIVSDMRDFNDEPQVTITR
jgi:HlyD family secretion protein